ncbi:14940_t:CDS:2, partial [Funneliformis caledonium]
MIRFDLIYNSTKISIQREDNQDKSDNSVAPCILKPIPIGVALLVIPLTNITSDRIYACNSFSDLLLSNKWITQDLVFPDNFQNDEDKGAKILPNGTYLIPQNDSSMQPTKRTFPLTK